MYKLCKKLCSAGAADTEASNLFVVFISNDKKQVCPTFLLNPFLSSIYLNISDHYVLHNLLVLVGNIVSAVDNGDAVKYIYH